MRRLVIISIFASEPKVGISYSSCWNTGSEFIVFWEILFQKIPKIGVPTAFELYYSIKVSIFIDGFLLRLIVWLSDRLLLTTIIEVVFNKHIVVIYRAILLVCISITVQKTVLKTLKLLLR